ncbi:hypothetical protein ACFX13_036011 [Malus domestica]
MQLVSQSSRGTILSTFYYGYTCSQLVLGGMAAQKLGGQSAHLSFVTWSLTYAFVQLDPNRATTMFPSFHSVHTVGSTSRAV